MTVAAAVRRRRLAWKLGSSAAAARCHWRQHCGGKCSGSTAAAVAASAAAVAAAAWWQLGGGGNGGGGKSDGGTGGGGQRVHSETSAGMAGVAAANAVLPPCADTVVIKTLEVTVMAGAQTTINNQLKAANSGGRTLAA